MKNVKTALAVVAGNFFYALSVTLFLLPVGLVSSGSTGVALFVNHFTGIPLSLFVFIFNAALLVLSYFVLGKQFAFNTAASTVIYPASLEISSWIVGNTVITQNLMLCAIFTGIGMGVALGIAFRAGASTGGMDIPPLVVQKLFKIPVGVSKCFFDCVVLFMQLLFRPVENLFYGVVLTVISSFIIDRMLNMGNKDKSV